MVKDKDGKQLKPGRWYQLFDIGINPYDYRRFVFLLSKHGNKVVVFELWRNSNNPDLSPSFNVLPDAFFVGHAALPISWEGWSDKVHDAFQQHKYTFIKKLFENDFAQRELRRLRS